MTERGIIKETMDREKLKERWNELKNEGMESGYYWLDDGKGPELYENGGMPEFPCLEGKFIVESCWYKKGDKSVEIRLVGGHYIVSEVCWNGVEPQNTKEYFVAKREKMKILFSEIVEKDEKGVKSIKKHAFVGFGKQEA